MARSSVTWQAVDGQWTSLQRGLGTVRAFRRWRPGFEEEGSAVGSLDEVVAVLRSGTAAVEARRVLRVLIAAARDGDELAALALVQGLRPFLGRMAASYEQPGLTELDDAVANVLAAFHAVLRTVDVDHVHLAAAVVYGVRQRLAAPRRVQHGWRPDRSLTDMMRTDTDTVTDSDSGREGREYASWGSVTGGSMERATVDRIGSIVASGVTQRVLSTDQARLLLLVAVGNSVASIAAGMGCPARTVHSRVSKATELAGKIAA